MRNAPVFSMPQQRFIGYLSQGKAMKEAAKLAGFTPEFGYQAFQQAITSKHMTRYAREVTRGKIDIEGAPAGYRVLLELLHDDKTAASLRVDIAKFLINHSVPAPKAVEEGGEPEKEIGEMSREELQALIRQTDDAMAKRGMMIDATPEQAFDDII